jgi:CBS domain-containing protein
MLIKHILAAKGGTVITIEAGQTLREVVKELAQHRIGALVVVDRASKPVGIITERDIVRAASQDEKFYDQSVAGAMTTNLVIGTLQDDVRAIEKTMTEKRFRHLPVVDQNKLAGIVSIGDIVKAQIEEFQGEIQSLQTYIRG